MLLIERILHLREGLGKTRKDVARELNLAESTYGKYELGHRQPSLEILLKLSDYFGVSTDYLLGLTNNPRLVVNANVEENGIMKRENKRKEPNSETIREVVDAYFETIKQRYHDNPIMTLTRKQIPVPMLPAVIAEQSGLTVQEILEIKLHEKCPTYQQFVNMLNVKGINPDSHIFVEFLDELLACRCFSESDSDKLDKLLTKINDIDNKLNKYLHKFDSPKSDPQPVSAR